MPSYKVKHGEIQVQAHFTAPLFNLLDPPASRLHSAFFSRLADFGISLDDVKLAQGIPNLQEASITYHLLSLNALVKISLDKVELSFFETTSLARERMEDIYKKTFEAMDQVAKGFQVKEFTVNIAFHGVLEDKSIEEFWKAFLPSAPKGLGPISGQGIVFYYGAGGNTKASSTVIDMSARISNGIFLRVSVTFDGSKISAIGLPKIVEETFNLQTTNLGLTFS